jgi:OFA family oxalate/formate antiporter-like MFS transporter
MNNNRRFLVLIGAIILQICLGSIYTWSLFNGPIAEKFGWEISQIVFTFSIAIFFFALATIFSGRLQKKIGPRKVATIGGLLYGAGVLLTSFASSLPMIYITYGVVAGVGVGFAYVCPLATLVKWFPEKKGTITGVAVGAFGLGSVIFKPIITSLLASNADDPMRVFFYLGIIYLVACTIGAQLFAEPEVKAGSKVASTDHEYTVKEMVKTPAFFIMWILFFVGCIPGLLAIGIAKNIGVDYIMVTESVAANAVVLIAVFNTIGRMGSGAASDKFGLRAVVTGLFIITVAAIGILIVTEGAASALLFYVALAGIAMGFGGLLAVVPPLVGDFYGVNNLGTNYGIIFQAYGIAALIGPVLKGSLEYKQIFIVSAVVAVVGLVASIVMKKPVKQAVNSKAA